MTSTITRPRPHRVTDSALWIWDSPTAPIALPARTYDEPRPAPRLAVGRRVGAGALAAALLLGVGAGAYVLGQRDATPTPVAAAAPSSVAPTTSVTPAARSSITSGPQLLDTTGRPVDDAVAAQVRVVYVALQQNDIEALERAEGAAGSDDGLTSFPHLTSATTRNHLLDALRTRPVHRGHTYRYRAGGYGLEFQQADGSLGAGLGAITGPWTENTRTATSSPSRPTTAASSTSVFPYGNGPTGRFGDGCGPYEHNLGGYCSPDTDVLDDNGKPDPSRAVVPGNLKNPSYGG